MTTIYGNQINPAATDDEIKERNWRVMAKLLQDGAIPTGRRLDVYDATGGQNIDGTTATLNLDTIRARNPEGAFSLASDEVTVSREGTYLIVVHLNVEGSSDDGDFEGQAWIEIDTGSGYTKITGSDFYVG